MRKWLIAVTLTCFASLSSAQLMSTGVGGGDSGSPAPPTTYSTTNKDANVTLSGGNLSSSVSGGSKGFVGGSAFWAKKCYFEIFVSVGSNSVQVGVVDALYNKAVTFGLGQNDADSAGYFSNAPGGGGTANLNANSGTTSIAANAYTTGTVIGVALDQPNHLIYWRNNVGYQNSANPAGGTGGVDYISTLPMAAAFYSGPTSNASSTLNVGATAFTYTPPSGFPACL